MTLLRILSARWCSRDAGHGGGQGGACLACVVRTGDPSQPFLIFVTFLGSSNRGNTIYPNGLSSSWKRPQTHIDKCADIVKEQLVTNAEAKQME